MSATTYKEKILEFYDPFITHSLPMQSQAVAWSTKDSQYARFEVLTNIGVEPTDTILDLGCGMGHYTEYLNLNGYDLHNYTGIDINEKYIRSCSIRKNNLRFICGEIQGLNERYDYIIGSGVFTVGLSKNDIFTMLEKSYQLCRKGMAFNFINKEFLSDEEYNTFVPEEWYEIIKGKFGNSKLVNDYLPGEDFTIYIYK